MQLHLQVHRIASILFLAMLTGSVRAEMLLYVGAANGYSVERFNGFTGTFVDHFSFGGPGQSALALGPNNTILVGGWSSGLFQQFDGITGGLINIWGNLQVASPIVSGPDGNYYAAGLGGGIDRYAGNTGSWLGNFANERGVYTGFTGMRFGPDGNLYVWSHNADTNAPFIIGTSDILKYNGLDGTFMGNFIPNVGAYFGNGGDLVFGPDGNLYVSLIAENVVRRYDGITGAFIDDFASGGGLNGPFGLSFGPDGNLYVASHGSDSVLRYNGATGEFMDTFATVSNAAPTYLLFADVAAVPEPSVFALGTIAMLLLGYKSRRYVE